MNSQDQHPLWEAGLRRPPTPEERAHWDAWETTQPEVGRAAQEDLELNRLLLALPDHPVPSNFTDQVLQRIERASPSRYPVPTASWNWTWLWRSWPMRVAWASLVLGAGLLLHQQVEWQRRASLAHSTVLISDVSTLVSPEILRDFDAIQRFGQVASPVDEVLLAALRPAE